TSDGASLEVCRAFPVIPAVALPAAATIVATDAAIANLFISTPRAAFSLFDLPRQGRRFPQRLLPCSRFPVLVVARGLHSLRRRALQRNKCPLHISSLYRVARSQPISLDRCRAPREVPDTFGRTLPGTYLVPNAIKIRRTPPSARSRAA